MSTIKFLPVGLNNIPALEHWFEEMAAKGLYLEDCSQWIAYFKSCTPAKVRYRLEPIDKFQVIPNPKQAQLELYEESGWHYVNTVWRFYYAFMATDPDAPELHTDPKLQSLTLTRLIRRIAGSACYLLFFTLLPALFFLYAFATFPAFWAAVLYLKPILIVLSLLLLPWSFVFHLHRLWGLRRLQKQLEQGVPLQPKRGKSWLPRFFKVYLGLLLLTLLAWGRGYLSSWEKGGDLAELVPFSLLTLQEVEQNESLELEPMHHVKALNVTIGSFVAHNCYDLAPESYTVYQHSNDLGDLKIDWFDLRFPSTAQPIAEDVFTLHTAEQYQDERDPESWTVVPISHGDADLILGAEKEDGWLVCAAKGDKVVVVECTGEQAFSHCLDGIVTMVAE